MLKFFVWTAVILVVAIAGLLLFATTRPDEFRVARSIPLNASPEKIFPLINELKTFDTWNPFAKEAGMTLNYSGPPAGPGATNTFAGKSSGKLAILESTPSSQVVMQLDMEKPLPGSNRIVFTIAPDGAGSMVTWTMQGKTHYVAKVVGVFVSMDTMIGGQFEKGLVDLKTLAEK